MAIDPSPNGLIAAFEQEEHRALTIWKQISEIVGRNLHAFYEIEALDTRFRRPLNADQRREQAPWIMSGRETLCCEELEIWQKLDRGEISNDEAIAEMRLLMASYYGQS